MIQCPMCDADIDIEEDDLDEGEVISCDECGESLRVTSVDPLELESAEDYEEDEEEFYDDDDDEEDDEDDEDDDDDWK